MSSPIRALVTGGGTGIGYACAAELAASGATVGIAGRRAHVLERAVARMVADTGNENILGIVADVSTETGPQRLVDEFVEGAGGIDVLINSAGTCAPTPTIDLTAQVWDSVVNGALRGAALCSVAAARVMHDLGGRIVMITSIDEHQAEPNVAHYCAAKAGLGAFARSLAVDLAHRGIVVNSVAPGWVRTDASSVRLDQATPASMRRLNPLNRAGDPSEVAAVVRFLALEAPRYLTGSTIVVDGAQTVKAAMP